MTSKSNIIALVATVLTLFFSCNSKKIKFENDLTKQGLKGEVVFVQSKNAFESSLEINDDGMIVKRFTTLPEYDIYEEEEYIYSGRKIMQEVEYRIVAGNSLMMYVGNYTYSKDGQHVKFEKFVDDHKVIKEYKYLNNLLVEEIVKEKDYTTEIRYYYTNGHLDSIINYARDLVEKNQSKGLQYYDEVGNKIKMIYLNEKGDTLSSVNFNRYNDKGLVIESSVKNESENKTYSYTYEFDSVGNWIKQYADGKLYSERFIYYKGSDYSSKIAELNKLKFSLINKAKRSIDIKSNSESYQENTAPLQTPEHRQWVNCRTCHGQGVEVCSYCGGSGKVKCGNCDGTGIWGYNKKTCVGCGGQGEKYCNICSGKGTRGRCTRCDGRGQVLE